MNNPCFVFTPGRGEKYCDEYSVCLSDCLFVHFSVRSHILRNHTAELHQFSVCWLWLRLSPSCGLLIFFVPMTFHSHHSLLQERCLWDCRTGTCLLAKCLCWLGMNTVFRFCVESLLFVCWMFCLMLVHCARKPVTLLMLLLFLLHLAVTQYVLTCLLWKIGESWQSNMIQCNSSIEKLT